MLAARASSEALGRHHAVDGEMLIAYADIGQLPVGSRGFRH